VIHLSLEFCKPAERLGSIACTNTVPPTLWRIGAAEAGKPGRQCSISSASPKPL